MIGYLRRSVENCIFLSDKDSKLCKSHTDLAGILLLGYSESTSGGGELPSMGLRLNGSKLYSRLVAAQA